MCGGRRREEEDGGYGAGQICGSFVQMFKCLEGQDDHMAAKMMCDDIYLQNILDAYRPH